MYIYMYIYIHTYYVRVWNFICIRACVNMNVSICSYVHIWDAGIDMGCRYRHTCVFLHAHERV